MSWSDRVDAIKEKYHSRKREREQEEFQAASIQVEKVLEKLETTKENGTIVFFKDEDINDVARAHLKIVGLEFKDLTSVAGGLVPVLE